MRIGLVLYGDVETLTGGYFYDRRLLAHLAARGDDAEVISIPRRGALGQLGDNLSPALRRRLVGGRFDVLVEDELAHPSLFALNRWLRRRTGRPVVAIVHLLRSCVLQPPWLVPLAAALERRYLASVDGAVFTSEANRSAAERLVGRALPGIVAHPGGDHLGSPVSAAEVAARAHADGPLRVLSVANVLPGKALHLLVEALARLPAGSWRWTVAGSLSMHPDYVDGLRREIARAGLGDRIDLLGAVPNAELPALFAAHHVLAVPSSYEALGIAYLEAMAFGLPVLAAAAGGAREIVEHGREGFLVEPGDGAALTRHLERLAADRGLLARMGLAALARSRRHPSWEESCGRVRTFLATRVAESRAKEAA